MEMVVLLLIFIITGSMGFLVMKKLDTDLAKIRRQPEYITESREDVIKIVCENPNMLSTVASALDQMPKEYKKKTRREIHGSVNSHTLTEWVTENRKRRGGSSEKETLSSGKESF